MSFLPTLRRYLVSFLLAIFILILGRSVSAQETISLNQTRIGQLTGAGPNSYLFIAPPGLSVHVEIIAATEGLAPQFSIYNSSNALVQTIGNPTLGLVVENTITLPSAGEYRIDVSSASGAIGQFVIQLSPGSPSTPAIPLVVNTPVNGTLAANERATYSFIASPQNGLGVEISTNGTAGLSATLADASGVVVGMLGNVLTGGQFDILPGQSAFRLELANDGSLSSLVGYQVVLTDGDPGLPISTSPVEVISPTATVGDTLPPLPESGACVVATAAASPVNIRTTSSTDSAIIGQMSPQSVYPVTGVNADRSWYQITFNGQTGWVASFVIRIGGICTAVPIVSPPPTLPPPTIATDIPLPTLTLTTEVPLSTPTLAMSELNSVCAEIYGGVVYRGGVYGDGVEGDDVYGMQGNCYACTFPHSIVNGFPLTCVAPAYTYAWRYGPGTGLLGTDCPDDQFWDPNGYCYRCPEHWERTVFPVSSDRACEHDGSSPPAPVLLGPPHRP